tara:strand:- start:3080 stop:3295 length:216 start_codon:yes stop_codon:yes gene_type:complete
MWGSDEKESFIEGFTGQKKKAKKKYADMSAEEKEVYLREKAKNKKHTGFDDGGVAKKKKSYFSKIKGICKK